MRLLGAAAASLALLACSSDPAATSSGGTAADASTAAYAVGGTVSGLRGGGLVLQNAGGDDLAIAADGAFAFPTRLGSGAAFTVTVKTQPSAPAQTCTVSGGTGTIGRADVTSVAIACADSRYTVGGKAVGLLGSVVVNDGVDDLTVSANGTFAFPTALETGAAYAVTVKTQPSAPSQTCVLANATGTIGTAPVTDVALTCTTDTFTIGGSVSGLAGSGLVLTANTGEDLPVTGSTFRFTTGVASGQPYTVAVKSAPTGPSQTCTVTNASGVVASADVGDVAVACTTNRYPLRVTVAGLTGTLVLQNGGGDDLTFAANGTKAFATQPLSGAGYAVTVKTRPAGQVCTLGNAVGTVGGGPVEVTAACVTVRGPTHTFAGLTSNHYMTQGTCSIGQGGNQGDADYFCQHFYANAACVAASFTPGNVATALGVKMHKRGGCSSNGTDIPGTTCAGGACKIGSWNEVTSGLNDIVCLCP